MILKIERYRPRIRKPRAPPPLQIPTAGAEVHYLGRFEGEVVPKVMSVLHVSQNCVSHGVHSIASTDSVSPGIPILCIINTLESSKLVLPRTPVLNLVLDLRILSA